MLDQVGSPQSSREIRDDSDFTAPSNGTSITELFAHLDKLLSKSRSLKLWRDILADLGKIALETDNAGRY